MPTAEYETRTDSVLAWKKAQKLGRFDPDAPSIEQQKILASQREIDERGKPRVLNSHVSFLIMPFFIHCDGHAIKLQGCTCVTCSKDGLATCTNLKAQSLRVFCFRCSSKRAAAYTPSPPIPAHTSTGSSAMSHHPSLPHRDDPRPTASRPKEACLVIVILLLSITGSIPYAGPIHLYVPRSNSGQAQKS